MALMKPPCFGWDPKMIHDGNKEELEVGTIPRSVGQHQIISKIR